MKNGLMVLTSAICLASLAGNGAVKEMDAMGRGGQISNVVAKASQSEPMYLADRLSYLTMRVRSVTAGGLTVGTGFFFHFRMKDKSGEVVPALVTNKHVIHGSTETTFLFTVAENGMPTDRTVECKVRDGAGKWIAHPDPEVDLCAFPIQPVVEHFRKQGTEVCIAPLTGSMVADENFLQSVTQLDDVAMIGYPDGVWDRANNQPIFRKGVFATRPSRPYNGKREFLIDMPVYNGSSGSPVLIASDGPWLDRSRGTLLTRGPTKLVGIVYQTFIHNAEGRLVAVPIPVAANDQNMAAITRVPNNLGLVISASRLLEMEDMLTEAFGRKVVR